MMPRIAIVGTISVLNLQCENGLKARFFHNKEILLNRALSFFTVSGNQVSVLMIEFRCLTGQLRCVADKTQSVDLRFVESESFFSFARQHHPPTLPQKLLPVDVSDRVPGTGSKG